MCLAKSPKAPDPVAPVAPLAAPAPMALADAAQSRKETGVSQLRISGRKASPDILGSGGAARAGLTLQGRKEAFDAAIAGSGG
jgi:hypothetical protein